MITRLTIPTDAPYLIFEDEANKGVTIAPPPGIWLLIPVNAPSITIGPGENEVVFPFGVLAGRYYRAGGEKS